MTTTKKGFRSYLQLLAEIDNALCCVSWPFTIVWNFLNLPLLRQSLITRIRFVLMLFLVCIICLLMQSSKSWYILNERVCGKLGTQVCEMLHGPGAVYRVLFTFFLYFLFMSFFMISVRNSASWRAVLHNHFWTLKYILLVISTIAFIFLPRNKYSGEVWHFFGLNSGFAFIILQFVILVDTVHSVNTRLVKWIENNGNSSGKYTKYCFAALWIPTLGFYLTSGLGTAYLYRQYSSTTDCINNLFFISFHVYMCLSATLISIHPIVQKARPKSGLLQSSIASSYSTYIMWLTLSNQPDDICNPSREYIYPNDPLKNKQILLSLLITFTILFVFCFRVFNGGLYGKYVRDPDDLTESGDGGEVLPGDNGSDVDVSEMLQNGTLDEPKRKTQLRWPSIIRDDEGEGVEYSYAFFHALLSVGSLYLMMTMTSWYRPEEEENMTVKLIAGWGAIWIKLCSGIFCVFLYIWSLVAPVIFPQSYRELVFYDMMFTIVEPT